MVTGYRGIPVEEVTQDPPFPSLARGPGRASPLPVTNSTDMTFTMKYKPYNYTAGAWAQTEYAAEI